MQILRVDEFSDFLEKTLNLKADCYLASLFKQFGRFFNIAKRMIELLIELDKHFEQENRSRTLINNAIALLNQFFIEHVSFVQWSYCEQFIVQGNERITQIRANIHPIFHQFDQTKIKKSLCEVLLNLQEKNTQLLQQMTLLSNEVNLHQIILKQKEEQYKKFNDNIEYIKQYKQTEDPEFKKYFALFIKLQPLQQSKILYELYKTIILCLINCSNLLCLLEVPIENSRMVKQIGKKNLKGNTHEVQLLMKYSQILVNKEQIWNTLNKQHYEDLAETIKLLEKQIFYKQPNDPFIIQCNLGELRSILSKKENLMYQLSNQFKKPEVLQEWNTIQPLGLITLQQLQEIAGQFFGHLSTFVRVTQVYQNTKQEISKFFDQNFGQIVQLECNEFDYLII
ncbi:unnamed protein product [Paramecium octaurelia]|uniref:Uncharacterized protein n=1 Tax=Paramecium octaurelia TaxID=43137 RepID=A0A8S1WT14_PAROT|nr:unnamed protein product [Paramecium octaurelia]